MAKCVSDQLITVPIKDRTNLIWANLMPDHLITGPTKFGRFCVFNQLKLVRGSKFHCSKLLCDVLDVCDVLVVVEGPGGSLNKCNLVELKV